MGELTKKLHYIKTGGSEETITLYSSTTDCPSPYLSFTVDGASAYAKLGDVSDSNASAIRVYRNSDGKTYAVLKLVAQSGTTDSYVTYDLSYPFTDNVGVLANLVDGSNFEIAESPTPYDSDYATMKPSIVSGSKVFSINKGFAYGYIKFHTPNTTNTDLLTVSVTCNAYSETKYDTGMVYIDTALHEITTNTKFTESVGESTAYGYILYNSYGLKTAEYSTYTKVLNPDTDYYLQFAYTKDTSNHYFWDRLSISNIKFTDSGTYKSETKKTYTVTIVQSSNQTIAVKCNGKTYASSFTATEGDTWAATLNVTDQCYLPGTLSATSGTISGNITISATAARLKYFDIAIPATENQSYTLTLETGSYGGTLPSYVSTATKSAQNLSVPVGTSYTITYTADTGYTAGASQSGTVWAAKSITHNAATAVETETSNTFTITSGTFSSYVGYSTSSAGWSTTNFGSTTANLPNGFTLKALFWHPTNKILYVTLSPALSQYISAIVFGDNEVAVASFVAQSSGGNGLYYAKMSDSTATWLANNAGSGKTVQVVIYANEL